LSRGIGVVLPAYRREIRSDRESGSILGSLEGQVTPRRRSMEGVLVRQKKADSTIAITVVTMCKAAIAFLHEIGAGHYAISIRAVGYDLDGPPQLISPRSKAQRRSEAP